MSTTPTREIQMWFTEEEYAWLVAQAKAEGVPLDDWVHQKLQWALAARATAESAVERSLRVQH